MAHEWDRDFPGFSDPAWMRPETLTEIERVAGPWDGRCCDDCGKGIRAGGHSMAFGDGVSRRWCDPCWRIRSRHGWELDLRPLRVLESEVA
jgi:hypothetical protein